MADRAFDFYSAFDYSAYLTFALALAKTAGVSPQEVLKRNAVSRAYYATFHGAKLFLAQIEGTILSPSARHETVWKEFEGKQVLGKRVLANASELKVWREWADYNDPDKLEPHDLESVFKSISRIQVALNEICRIRNKEQSLCWLLTASVEIPN